MFDKLITKENVAQLGFVDEEKVGTLVEDAFERRDAQAMRLSIILAQWVVMGKRFGVKRAEKPL